MTGHQPLLQARKSGFRPAAVWIEIGQPPLHADYLDPVCHAVYLQANEVSRADLSFCHGLRVHITGPTSLLILEAMGRARAFAPKAVVGHFDGFAGIWDGEGIREL